LLLGLNPLNLNDRMAVPMFGIFAEHADLTPYVPTAPPNALADVDRKRYDELNRPIH